MGERKEEDPFDNETLDARLKLGETSTHNILLNKFNVSKTHLLLTTKSFKRQGEELDKDDFRSVAFLLKRMKGFAFYNSGSDSGFSVPHKHLQFLALTENYFKETLIDFLLKSNQNRPFPSSTPFQFPQIPFEHYCVLMELKGESESEVAQILKKSYDELQSKFDWSHHTSYNLLLTEGNSSYTFLIIINLLIGRFQRMDVHCTKDARGFRH